REYIGTTYCKVSPQAAKTKGLDIVTPKIPDLLEQVRNKSEGEVVLFCWRGGLRSQSFANLCAENHIKVKVLQGGYKAYRRYINKFWSSPIKNRSAVLHGLTGVGKTEIIAKLACNKPGVIDIEGVANNRGSVFGQAHGGVQPSQKQFEALLFNKLAYLSTEQIILVECEGKRIGNLHLPVVLFDSMKKGYKIHLYASLEARIHRIIRDYGCFDFEVLKGKISLLTKYLGKKKIDSIQDLVNNNKLYEAVKILLVDYYDPLYGYSGTFDKNYDLSINCNNIDDAVEQISLFLRQKEREVLL
ncbi:MAG: tRNA 2-selenouridine(34) synthase MnmH, partial [Bacillota bacterium]|nr:tRNA 2-selenouridine(34) synthase MnmH [Bacillota bacterium]